MLINKHLGTSGREMAHKEKVKRSKGAFIQMRTLKMGLIRRLMPIVSASLLVLIAVCTGVCMSSTREIARTMLSYAAKRTNEAITMSIQSITAVSDVIADSACYSSDVEHLKNLANEICKSDEYILNINFLNHNGRSMFTGEDLSKQEAYLKVRSNNKRFISDVDYDDRTGCYMFYIAIPVISNGTYIGVIETKVDSKLLKDCIIEAIPGNSGNAFVVDGQGVCIATENEMLMFNRVSVEQLSSYDLSFSSMTRLMNTMAEQNEGFTTFEKPSGGYYAAFSTIAGTQSWRLAVTQSVMEYSSGVYLCFGVCFGLCAIIWIAIFLRLCALARGTSAQIKLGAERIKLILAGDLEKVEAITCECEELQELYSAQEALSGNMRLIIDETVSMLDQMAGGDIDTAGDVPFNGDYGRIKQALDTNISAINLIVARISRAAEEVARGSAQMAAGAVGLSIGASQQASAVSQLFTNVADMARGVENISKTDTSAAELEGLYTMLSDPTSKRSKMELMIAAMSNIAETSEEIRKIASMIEGIVSETGILAFNASVEAARAGSAGRGFSVIASEVRQLADRSKESLEIIKVQMNRIFEAIAVGKEMVDETVGAVDNMRQNVDQVKESLSQISSVIDNTAATSQETAAACEQLSAQAALLRDVVSQFNYKEN